MIVPISKADFFTFFCHCTCTDEFRFARAEKVIYLLLGALGTGPLFQVSLVAALVLVVSLSSLPNYRRR